MTSDINLERLAKDSRLSPGDQVRFWYTTPQSSFLRDIGTGVVADNLGATSGYRIVDYNGKKLRLRFLQWDWLDSTSEMYVDYEIVGFDGIQSRAVGADDIIAGVLAIAVVTGIIAFAVLLFVPEASYRLKKAAADAGEAAGDVVGGAIGGTVSKIGEGLVIPVVLAVILLLVWNG